MAMAVVPRSPQQVLLPVGELLDDTPIRIVCPSWHRSWTVPQQLINMTAVSIARLATHAVLTPDSSLSPIDHIQQAHSVLVGLASSNATVKYWLYLRMFWLCQGHCSDDIVLDHIAHIEGFSPTGAGASQRWDRVRRGLGIMEILLNHRQALVDLLTCRVVLLDQLVHLPVRYLQELVLIHLVSQMRHEGGEKMTIARLGRICRDFVDPPDTFPEPEPDVRRTAEALVSATRRRRREDSVVKVLEDGRSKRRRAMPQRLTSESSFSQGLVHQQRRPSAGHRRLSRKRSTFNNSSRSSADDEGDEGGEEEEEDQKKGGPESKESDGEEAEDEEDGMEAKDESVDRSISSIPAADPTLVHRLHVALVEMHSMPVLAYYLSLTRRFPNLISVAAPYSYSDSDARDQMIHHRLQDQCSTRLALYTNDFILESSRGFHLLPALVYSVDRSAFTCSTEEEAAPYTATKVWLFFPDEATADGEWTSNSTQALSVYNQWYPHLNASSTPSRPSSSTPLLWDEHGGRLMSLPASLLLQAGVRILLVIQRAGETVAMPGSSPSRYGSPCAHMVHTLPSHLTFSAAGNYCSTKHLVDHIGHRWSEATARSDSHPEGKEMDSVELRYSESVLTSNLPIPPPLLKPSHHCLQQQFDAMSVDSTCERQAWASELQSPNQMLYLLNCQLDDAQTALPPPSVIQQISRLMRAAPTVEDADVVATLFTKAITMTATRRPFFPCGIQFGCGSLRDDDDIKLPNGFRFSSANHQRPLLFVRSTAAQLGPQRDIASEIVDQWMRGDEVYHFNVSWPRTPTKTSLGAAFTTKEVHEAWLQCRDHRRMAGSSQLLRQHVDPVHTVYVQDIAAQDEAVHRRLSASLQRVLPEGLVRGGALQHCQVPTDGVHRPSFYLLRSSTFALEQNLACAARSDMHNESQRLGFWHHVLPGESLEALLRQRDLFVDITAVRGQSPLQAMYKHFSRLTKLPTAADAFAQSDQAQLSSFVSTSYGELALSSVDKMVACMIQHGVHPEHDLFFDVGSGYGRVVCHVALATAMTALGIEAVPARHQQASECITTCRALDRCRVHLYEGDILANLHLLLSATHVMVFDARFQPETRAILRHLWAHLAGSRLRLLFCIKHREGKDKRSSMVGEDHCIDGFQAVEQMEVTTGQNSFTMCAYQGRL